MNFTVVSENLADYLTIQKSFHAPSCIKILFLGKDEKEFQPVTEILQQFLVEFETTYTQLLWIDDQPNWEEQVDIIVSTYSIQKIDLQLFSSYFRYHSCHPPVLVIGNEFSIEDYKNAFQKGIVDLIPFDHISRLPMALQQAWQHNIWQKRYTQWQLDKETCQNYFSTLECISSETIYIWDVQVQQLTYISPQIEKILGFQVDEIMPIVNKGLSTIIHPEDAVNVNLDVLSYQHIEDEIIMASLCRLYHKDGSLRWVLIRETVLNRDRAGLPTEVLGSLVDVSEIKQCENIVEEFQERNNDYSKILDTNILLETLSQNRIPGEESNTLPDSQFVNAHIAGSSTPIQIQTKQCSRTDLNNILYKVLKELAPKIRESKAKICYSNLAKISLSEKMTEWLLFNQISKVLDAKDSGIPVIQISCIEFANKQELRIISKNSQVLLQDADSHFAAIYQQTIEKVGFQSWREAVADTGSAFCLISETKK